MEPQAQGKDASLSRTMKHWAGCCASFQIVLRLRAAVKRFGNTEYNKSVGDSLKGESALTAPRSQ
jgi:hypothetical protein